MARKRSEVAQHSEFTGNEAGRSQEDLLSEEYLEWLRNLPCVICSGWDTWNMDLGRGRNTPSHIVTRGAGGKDLYNALSMCMKCHRRFEDQSAAEKKGMLALAQKYTKRFLGEA